MCYADLVGANSLAPFQGGQDDGFLRMNFQAFSFAADKSDTIDIVSLLKWRHHDFTMKSLWRHRNDAIGWTVSFNKII